MEVDRCCLNVQAPTPHNVRNTGHSPTLYTLQPYKLLRIDRYRAISGKCVWYKGCAKTITPETMVGNPVLSTTHAIGLGLFFVNMDAFTHYAADARATL